MNIKEQIINLPKVELHCHLDGSLRPETVLDLCLKENINIPYENPEDFKSSLKISKNCSSLKEYLEKFYFPIRVMQKKENIYRVTMELLEDSKKDGIEYTEIRFAPFQHTEQDLNENDVVEAALEALQDGESKLGIHSNLILCSLRHDPVERSIDLVNLANSYNEGVCAVDLAGNESDFPPELHKEAFDLAYDNGIKITIHAGETGIAENILKSIKLLHADRIGHGIFAYKSEEILQYVIENQVPLEMCPKSNVDTKAVKNYKNHPFKKYFDLGVKVTLNTDNRTVSNVSLVDEYLNLANIFDFGIEEIKTVIRNGISASFATEEFKVNLLKKLD
ncbi:adenosine deaminase [Clostridium acetobutylicum]|uniref:Adenosine deaminase n=1 Tax=Clostridium acetobutylicum (strain ATCC 824 / DSM 792 / JCM 1419 / IAM 19013 / LMG 5710 / NBRC 13948 / NRRL B-527 / VKM B-1787 / 2291 / W) TaxID=272562 RepID=ADD_CLOAB|nr:MULTISPECIES: adenosine deaminase [Clostridium]Q97EV1.1 RecName: Full=Adenosine deaminase; AltName: Full=Adenosine aminohydrolase [Clostridium acetobutylicum ATCC 824]AAK80946.1 Adenosine deaminase [Clostridium acetobutylicum ATCC 824]ADZ22048.1 adenosine deaminase [Clostridium acetobutylicum EA 2018]AEI33407.1 adenosine deaminase [Clostridium acetobutylicum DSM 1731]AWV78643.1 adenosine deaminase [Clostridium acetobutylicum]MBC2393504.1 adenosine deaminase [Clostridium acetobutylicum]